MQKSIKIGIKICKNTQKHIKYATHIKICKNPKYEKIQNMQKHFM